MGESYDALGGRSDRGLGTCQCDAKGARSDSGSCCCGSVKTAIGNCGGHEGGSHGGGGFIGAQAVRGDRSDFERGSCGAECASGGEGKGDCLGFELVGFVGGGDSCCRFDGAYCLYGKGSFGCGCCGFKDEKGAKISGGGGSRYCGAKGATSDVSGHHDVCCSGAEGGKAGGFDGSSGSDCTCFCGPEGASGDADGDSFCSCEAVGGRGSSSDGNDDVRNGYSSLSAESASGAREDRRVTKGESLDGGCGSGFGDGFGLPRVQLVTAIAVPMLKVQVEIAATAAAVVISAHSVMSVTVVGRSAVVHALMAHESTATVEAAPRAPALELNEQSPALVVIVTVVVFRK